jgi:hypothetical protein
VAQSQTFTCPKCGAPQNYRGGTAPTIQCPFCDTTLIVPEALRTTTPNFAAFNPAEISREAGKLAEIKQLVDRGKKIEAIKLYRETFGTDLKESKDAVEALERGQSMHVAQINMGAPGSFQISQDGQDITISTTPDGAVNVSRRSASGLVSCIVVFVVVVVALSIVLPILLSVGAFAAFMPMFSQAQPTIVAVPPIVVPTFPAMETPTLVPIAEPTPQFANVVNEFGSKGTAAGEMSDARAIAVNNNGAVFVAEYIGGRVQIFDQDGNFVRQCLIDPQAPTPSVAAAPTGDFYVLQATTITKYDGNTCSELQVFRPALGEGYDHIATDVTGRLFATMTGNNKDSIVRLNDDGTVDIVVDNAIGGQRGQPELDPKLAIDGRGNLYVLGSFARAVYKFDRDGKFVDTIGSEGSEPGQFNAVQAIAVDSQERIFVSDSKGVQVFAPDGRYLDVFKVPKSVASGMAFNGADKLWIAAREQVYEMDVQ